MDSHDLLSLRTDESTALVLVGLRGDW